MFLDKAVADRNAVQTVSRLNRCHTDKENVVVVDFTNNAKNILKAFNKYRNGSPHEPDEPDVQQCLDLYQQVLDTAIFTQEDAEVVIKLIREDNDGDLQTLVNNLRKHFQQQITDPDERKSFVYLLAKLVKSYHFLNSFFSYDTEIQAFVAFCEYVGPQLIKEGSVSDLMKLVRATVVTKSNVTYEGEIIMPEGQQKPKSGKGGGAVPPVQKVSVQDMIEKIRDLFDISDEEALHIREVSDEKIADESIRFTIAAHKQDTDFLDTIYKGQLNRKIQSAYLIRDLFEPLGDPKYTDKGAIFDIMAYTVIQKGLEMSVSV
jgi:type I restriction enzyme R subunit